MMNYEPYFCPLLCIAAAKCNNPTGGHCLGAHCAWWDDEKSQCAVTRLCDIDATLSEELSALAAPEGGAAH
ncbi:MAG: hypothetical protein LUC47_11550 [Clostridiales bacterium]|nr:hypothetical protein [Clostridiales bacterium]